MRCRPSERQGASPTTKKNGLLEKAGRFFHVAEAVTEKFTAAVHLLNQ